MFVHTVIMVIEPHMKQGRQHKLISTIFLATSVTKKLDHNTSSLMEQILSSDNLNRAYLQVVRNKGAEGVDGMKYTELKEYLAKNGEIIKEQLREREYKP